MELIILIGIQGAGKSTFSRLRFANHKTISLDLIRSRNKCELQARLLDLALSSGQSVVIDNSNVTRKERRRLISAGRMYGARILGYCFEPSLQASLRHNRRRFEGKVPEVAIFAALKTWEEPDFQEGFDELFVVRTAEDWIFRIWPRTRNQPER